MPDGVVRMMELQPVAARAGAIRTEIINAIADLAIAARAGTLLRAYQREWAWVDRQNYVDAVDADEFNEAFHGIEREFDKLAEILAQGASPSMAPTWEQEVTLAQGSNMVTLSHGLGTTNLLVDLQARFVVPGRVAGPGAVAMLAAAPTAVVAPGSQLWVNLGLGVVYAYALSDDNTIILVRFSGENIPHSNLFPADLTLRVRLWKLGE